ncbi:Glycosyltransferase involved in cell wall bisynthesis [Singulisphaera sp. GP187]|uniref:glycosyltransferase family 4 protein n=1 Tax=Singulisphaera sp. GP187 TaxID=1882752 RepID=UPI00092BBBF0|nr:glycosyltransferase family 4 protein [Singulisphaera sp. GP187]SIN67666.1 Glycosyltransferase involved in cell wall bisynthesis [Singulisphaera sp. GP187]
MHILTLSTLFPNALQPVHALFVRARMEHFSRQYGHRWTVVAPVPFFPKLPFRTFKTYDTYAQVPRHENARGYPVHHPRYLVTPKVGMRFYGAWLTAGVRRLVKKLHASDPFDVIDGHFVYPDGTAAARLGKELNIPVVLSARGTDLNLYPKLPGIANLIRSNLNSVRHLICVCEGLKQEALKLGIPQEKVSVIGNGIDSNRFRRGDPLKARKSLGLPLDANIILSVGHLIERKGFHFIMDAVSRLGRDKVVLAIVGDGPERGPLEQHAKTLQIEDQVRFAGAVSNDNLPVWYQAADVFALASSREGWPNVLCEAQACGLPVVATKVWGIPEIIHSEGLGIMVEQRSADGLHAGLEQALLKDWDRSQIATVGSLRTWDRVSEELAIVFDTINNPR